MNSIDTTYSGLQLRDVGNVAAHRRRGDKAAITIVVELLTLGADTSHVLPSPDLAGRFGAVKDRIQIGRDDFVVVI